MARLSLWLGLMSAVPGCLVDAPSHYEPSAQTPPLLLLNQASPSVLDVLNISPQNDVPPSRTFNVPVRSEDAGDDLIALLLLDYPSKPFDLQLPPVQLAASTFDAPFRREISVTWTYNTNLPRGCHTVTLLVTHSANYVLSDGGDIAQAVWWLNVSDDGTNLLGDCPHGSQTQ